MVVIVSVLLQGSLSRRCQINIVVDIKVRQRCTLRQNFCKPLFILSLHTTSRQLEFDHVSLDYHINTVEVTLYHHGDRGGARCHAVCEDL